MILIDLIICISLFSGFELIGRKVINYSSLDNFFDYIINVKLINFTIGFIIFSIIIYSCLVWKLILLNELKLFLYSFIIIGIYNLYNYQKFYEFNFKFKKLKKLNLQKFFLISLLTGYFLLSLSPITDADSSAYHLFIPKYFIENSDFPVQHFNFQTYLLGLGEIINIFGLLLNLEIFPSLLNFIGLLIILSIVFRLSKQKEKKYFYGLLILSCPIFIPLVNTAKLQLVFISIITVGYSIIINIFSNKKEEKNLFSIFFFLCLICIAGYLSKITFLLSYFSLILFFFIFYFKFYKLKFFYKFISIFIISNLIFLIPPLIWKINIYQIDFLNILIKPFPDIPGMEYFILNAKNYFSDKNYLTYLIPVNITDITNTFGVLLFAPFFLLKKNFDNKKKFLFLIISYISIILLFSQRSPRFFLEIYVFAIFLISLINFEFEKYKIYKLAVFGQSLIILVIIFYGVLNLLPGKFNQEQNNKVFSKFANGYLLYRWTNTKIPLDKNFLTNHRSIYFSNGKPLFLEFTFFLHNRNHNKNIINYHLDLISRQQKPKFILFWGEETLTKSYNKINFENCLDSLIARKDKVGFHAARNPFNAEKIFYPAEIYSIKKNIGLDKCIEIKS